MDNDLLKSMFLRARDHYENATRWAFIVICVCLALHLLTFSQFVRLGKQLFHVQTELSDLSGLQSSVAEVEARLYQIEKAALGPLDDQVNRLREALIADFQMMDRQIAAIRGDSGESVTTPLQTSIGGPTDAARLFAFDDASLERIRQTKDIAELRDVLQPIIAQEILLPRFTELNESWRNRILPQIKAQTDELLTFLNDHTPALSNSLTAWDAIRQNVQQTAAVAGDLSFQPPDGTLWWASVSGKTETLAETQEAAVKRLSTAINVDAVRQFNHHLKDALEQQKALQQTLQTALEKIEATFTKQQAQLTKLGKPFEFLSFDITILVSRFPLLLGFILAGITLWPAQRLWELALTADLLAKHGPDPLPMEWLLGCLCPIYPKRCLPPDIEDTSHYHQILVESVGRGLLFWLWIGFAAWELYGWGELTSANLAALTLGGWLAVAAALGYRAYIIRRIFHLKETGQNPSE